MSERCSIQRQVPDINIHGLYFLILTLYAISITVRQVFIFGGNRYEKDICTNPFGFDALVACCVQQDG